MSLLTALTSHLLSDAGLSALVGARIYPEKMPASTSATPNTMPLVTYQLIDEPVTTTHDRQVLPRARIQIDAWGGSYKSAHTTASAVFAALHGYRGALGDQSVNVGSIFCTSKRDASDPNVELFRVSQDFTVHYKEN